MSRIIEHEGRISFPDETRAKHEQQQQGGGVRPRAASLCRLTFSRQSHNWHIITHAGGGRGMGGRHDRAPFVCGTSVLSHEILRLIGHSTALLLRNGKTQGENAIRREPGVE
jgi:hypothetical protein